MTTVFDWESASGGRPAGRILPAIGDWLEPDPEHARRTIHEAIWRARLAFPEWSMPLGHAYVQPVPLELFEPIWAELSEMSERPEPECSTEAGLRRLTAALFQLPYPEWDADVRWAVAFGVFRVLVFDCGYRFGGLDNDKKVLILHPDPSRVHPADDTVGGSAHRGGHDRWTSQAENPIH
ncbi:hypothetical protein [Nocardia aurantia]|uniref:hypothetical protein n=1 Tax=Nocardia aurantia TaxID=2585199 RepID=UPI00129595CF|nr:hypothetical protein [Nocardia aurantia]